jgi:hypothetical protein
VHHVLVFFFVGSRVSVQDAQHKVMERASLTHIGICSWESRRGWAEKRGQGTGDRGQGTGDRGQGTGDRGQGTGDRGTGRGG